MLDPTKPLPHLTLAIKDPDLYGGHQLASILYGFWRDGESGVCIHSPGSPPCKVAWAGHVSHSLRTLLLTGLSLLGSLFSFFPNQGGWRPWALARVPRVPYALPTGMNSLVSSPLQLS